MSKTKPKSLGGNKFFFIRKVYSVVVTWSYFGRRHGRRPRASMGVDTNFNSLQGWKSLSLLALLPTSEIIRTGRMQKRARINDRLLRTVTNKRGKCKRSESGPYLKLLLILNEWIICWKKGIKWIHRIPTNRWRFEVVMFRFGAT